MDKDRLSTIVAVIFGFAFFVGLPLVAHKLNLLNFKDYEAARGFLLFTAAILGFQLLATTSAKNNFTFSEYGFGLCLTSVGGFTTIIGLAILKNSPMNWLYPAAQSFSLLLFGLTLLISTGNRNANGTLHPGLRAINYLIGAFSFETYLIFMIMKEGL